MGENRNWRFMMSVCDVKNDHEKFDNWHHFLLLGVSPYMFTGRIWEEMKSEKFNSDTTIRQLGDLIANVGKKHSFTGKVESGHSTMLLDQVNYDSDDDDNTESRFDVFLVAFDFNELPSNLTAEGNLKFILNNYTGGVIVRNATISCIASEFSKDPTPPKYYFVDGNKTELYVAGQSLKDILLWWRK